MYLKKIIRRFNLGFQKAKKEKIWTKTMLAGSAGSGKSYSALRLATGIANRCGGRIAAIDTENGRLKYYANEFDFDTLTLEEPYTPEKYIDAINDAVSGGYAVVIIDSTTHEWSYCKELVSKIPGANEFTKWKSITPRHNAFVEKILQAPIHTICTVRGKDAYVLETQENGKVAPKKKAGGIDQRGSELEYNSTLAFMIDQEAHVAQVMKDNTSLFDGKYDILTEKHGEMLYAWANDGQAVVPKIVIETQEEIDAKELQIVLDELKEICGNATRVEKIVTATELNKKVGELNNGVTNFTKNTDLDATIKLKGEVIEYLESLKKA